MGEKEAQEQTGLVAIEDLRGKSFPDLESLSPIFLNEVPRHSGYDQIFLPVPVRFDLSFEQIVRHASHACRITVANRFEERDPRPLYRCHRFMARRGFKPSPKLSQFL